MNGVRLDENNGDFVKLLMASSEAEQIEFIVYNLRKNSIRGNQDSNVQHREEIQRVINPSPF